MFNLFKKKSSREESNYDDLKQHYTALKQEIYLLLHKIKTVADKENLNAEYCEMEITFQDFSKILDKIIASVEEIENRVLEYEKNFTIMDEERNKIEVKMHEQLKDIQKKIIERNK